MQPHFDVSAHSLQTILMSSHIFLEVEIGKICQHICERKLKQNLSFFFAFFLFIFHIDRDNNAIQAFFRDIVRVIWTFSNLWLFTFEAQKQTVLKLVANVPA